ncbi:expressed unknown protein [Seminavis robusta]|uniref:MYND-type domain-containing protein n=1 Tax=Seminavis robusta TaxID=568900 RepID=A0A9N8E1X0_9STRA|nr:expressed unknown protein [Seminavis robusta]|eukprot:Sro564_g167440.1 n/a (408) ;mRNA; r:43995-45218
MAMVVGQRVRITRPPKGRGEWTDQEATVLTLIPVAKEILDYKIRVDKDESEEVLSAACLEPSSFDEEKEEGMFSCLVVNGSMYCLDHRLEVCGECGVDHRSTNLPDEIDEKLYDNGSDAVNKLIDDLNRIGVAGRIAPSKRSKAKYNCPANTAVFQPNVNGKLLPSEVPDNDFDPRQGNPWPDSVPTEKFLRVHSDFPNTTIPEEFKLPVRRLRETICVAGHRWQHFFTQERGKKTPMVRLLLQDGAQSQVLTLDLVLPIQSLVLQSGMVVPIFVVRYAHVMASNMQSAVAVMSTMVRNTPMGEIPAEVDEIVLFANLLKENGKRLAPAFVRSVEQHKKLLKVSFFTSISEEMQQAYCDSLKSYCFRCGTSDVKTQKCARCQKATYCSRQCQRFHWKYHKRNGCQAS